MKKQENDLYMTLGHATTEQIYKEKGSKFLAYAYPITAVEETEKYLDLLKKTHAKARHWCYAWQLGVEQPTFRYNDDGEPNNSAGKPIYGQIQSFGLTGVLIVVVRYFGGTKLGVGGLINAYRSAARLALENAELVEKMLKKELILIFDYADMDKVMRVIKDHQLEILDQKMDLACELRIAVRKGRLEDLLTIFDELRNVDVKMVS